MVSVGPTTSMRMEKFEYEFTKETGVRVIVGKGGMGPNTKRHARNLVHLLFRLIQTEEISLKNKKSYITRKKKLQSREFIQK